MRRYEILISFNGENTAFAQRTVLIVELDYPNEAVARERARNAMAAQGKVVDRMVVRDLGDVHKH